MAKLYTYGLTYRCYDFIKNWRYYRKVRKAIKDVFYADDFKYLIKQYLNVELDKDWLGRLYGVINPNIDIDGNFNVNNVIIEIDGDRTNNNEYVKTWLYRQLNLMGQLFNMKNLYSNISMEIEHVGPITQDNYLIIFDVDGRQEMSKSFKKMMGTLVCYIGIGMITLGTLLFTHII